MQSVHLDQAGVLRRYSERTRKSAELFARAQSLTPGGVMGGIKFFEPHPIFMERGSGAHLWDVDGNQYVDYLLSYGAIVLGHGAGVAKGAMSAVMEGLGTTVLGTPTALEAEYGETLRDVYHPGGMLRFTNSGLEATLLAMRVAKAHTRRKVVAKFEGHYHGAVDRFLFNYVSGVEGAGPQKAPVPVSDSADVDPGIISESLVLPFNDLEGTEELLGRRARDVACVIMEPFEEGVIPAEKKFMTGLRRVTRDLGIPLVFDEVKTGFRVRVGGATEYYSVTPDLTCLGKIIGGGLPIGALVGGKDIMEHLDPRAHRSRRVFHSGTFNGNPLSLTVGKATVRELMRPGRFAALVGRTEELKRGLAAVLRERRIHANFQGEGGMFNYYLTDRQVRNYRDARKSDHRLRRLIDLALLTNGVYLKPEGRFCLSLSHSVGDVKFTAERFARAIDSVVRHRHN